MRVLIAGGGLIGSFTALELAKQGCEIHVLVKVNAPSADTADSLLSIIWKRTSVT